MNGRIPPTGQNPSANPPTNSPPPAYSRQPNPAVEYRNWPTRPPAYDAGPPPPYSPPSEQQQGSSGAPVWSSAASVWQHRRPGDGGDGSGSGSAGATRESSV